MTARTDTQRLILWFRDHPRSSVMEARFALFISGVTQRMSDARAQGYQWHKYRDQKGIWRFSVTEPGQGTLGLVEDVAS